MATYKGIKGVKVQSLASDPPTAQSLGQLWYNTTSSVLKYSIEGAGTWSAGGNTNTAVDLAGYCGTQTAAMYFGGRSSGPATTNSETYNGTAWTETADLTTATYQNAGFGTTTAAISTGGITPVTANTFTYNGTSWTAGNDLTDATRDFHGTGTQTAGLIAGGQPTARGQDTATYDGTSWTETNDLQSGRHGLPLAGTTTAAIAIGGESPGPAKGLLVCETYDGTSWTEVNDLNDPKHWSGCCGTTTAALNFAGANEPSEPITKTAESWNGTSWTSIADLATARTAVCSGQASPNTAALCFGGEVPPIIQSTEEYNDPVLATKTVTVS